MHDDPSQRDENDAALRALLHRHMATMGSVPDDGFADRVMRALPPSDRQSITRWAPLVGAVVGAVVALIVAGTNGSLGVFDLPGASVYASVIYLAPLMLVTYVACALVWIERG
jgi:hypothetical protein